MTNISKEDVLKLAKLARLDLTTDEVEKYALEISSIFGYVDMLQSIDTEGIEPTYQVTGLVNVMRADEMIDYETSPNTLLKNAPDTEKNQFKVNRMVG